MATSPAPDMRSLNMAGVNGRRSNSTLVQNHNFEAGAVQGGSQIPLEAENSMISGMPPLEIESPSHRGHNIPR